MSFERDTFDTQLLTSSQQLDKIRDEWERFLNEPVSIHGFWQNPSTIQGNIEYQQNGKPFVVILRKNGQIHCIAPCIIEASPLQLIFSVFRIPGPEVRILKIIDSKFIFSLNANIENCISQVIKILHQNKSLFDIIKLEHLEDCDPLSTFFKNKENRNYFRLKTTSPKPENIWKHYFLESYDDWLKTLGKSTRRLTQRRIKNLYDNFPDEVEFRIITNSSEIPEFLNLLHELYPKTWQAKTFGLKNRNTKLDQNFYQNIAEQGWLRNYMLLIKDRPVAFLTATQYAGTFEAQEIGYDTHYHSQGVGSALNYLVIQDLYNKNKPTVLSFGFGDNKYKTLLCNYKSPATDAYLTHINFAGLLIHFQLLLSSLEQTIRTLLIRLNLDQKLRNILKRK